VRRILLPGIVAGALLALSAGVVQSSPPAGTTLSIRSLNAKLMAKPQFLGPSVASLRRGHRVTMVKAQGSWYLVSFRGRQGWVHRNRVTKKVIKLKSGDTGTGTSRGEAELAGRGFSPKTEETFKEKNPNLDFNAIDKIQSYDVDPNSTEQFYVNGGLDTKYSKGGEK